MSQYRFYIDDGTTRRQVYPLKFTGCTLSMQRNGDSVYFQRKLSGVLRFVNIAADGIDDYDYLYAIENSASKCLTLTFEIEKSCDLGETWASYWIGKFGTSDGYWNLDKCYFEVLPKIDDEYGKLNSGIKINILEIPDKVTVYAQGSSAPLDRNYTRCRLFSDMLEYLVTQSNGNLTGVVSNFFQINPTSVSDTNYVTQEYNTYTEMCVAQKSDIKEPIPSDEATRAPLSFKDCMSDLRKLFNVYWSIEGTTVRIEHLSYYATTVGLDLTQAQYDKYTSGKRAYKYISSERPKYETWDMPESSQGARITYDNACGNDNENESEISYTVTELYTDFLNIRYGLISNLNGIMLFACVYNGGTGKYDQLSYSRGDELNLGRLVLRFHRHGRPQLTGELEYFNTEATSNNWDKSHRDYGTFLIWNTKKTKQGDEITIPFCCEDTFDETKLVTTALGNGQVQKADQTFDTKSVLKLTLIYGEDDTDEITLPSEVSGLQAWYKSDTGITESPAGVVQTWADQSGNGYNLTQGTGANRPILVASAVNGFPAVRFDGVNDGLQSSVSIATFPSKRGTCFVICKPTAEYGNGMIFGTYAGGGSAAWDISVDEETLAPTMEFCSLSEGYKWKMSQEFGDPFLYGSENYVMFCLRRDSDTEYFGWLSGKKHRETANSNPMPATGQPVSSTLKMGQSFLPGHYYKGDVVEVILYSRMLTDVERQQVERYLFKRYKHLRSYMLV